MLVGQAADLVQQRGLRRAGRAAQRALHRGTQIGQRVLDLLGGAPALLTVQLGAGRQRHRHAEQPLDDTVVDLAGQVDAVLELARPLLGASGPARAGREGRDLAQRPQQVGLGAGQRTIVRAPREDDPRPAPRRAHRRAHQARVGDQVGVGGGHLGGGAVGRLHDTILAQRPQGDRGLLDGGAHLAEPAELDPVAAHGAHAAQRRVVEEEDRAVHLGQAARRLAHPAVEAAVGILGVEGEEQIGQRLHRAQLDAGGRGVCGARHARSVTGARRPRQTPAAPPFGRSHSLLALGARRR
jgi:hypothetical protein